jgi:nitrite reductase/ring-hydroxylating ferredoxin subunit
MTGESLATLPVGWLLDPDAFMRERRTIFADAWQMIACAEMLSAAGDYVCHNLAGLAAVAMRSETDEILAFRNACRHQKLPVLDAGRENARSCVAATMAGPIVSMAHSRKLPRNMPPRTGRVPRTTCRGCRSSIGAASFS